MLANLYVVGKGRQSYNWCLYQLCLKSSHIKSFYLPFVFSLHLSWPTLSLFLLLLVIGKEQIDQMVSIERHRMSALVYEHRSLLGLSLLSYWAVDGSVGLCPGLGRLCAFER